jgi:hypothetical protein
MQLGYQQELAHNEALRQAEEQYQFMRGTIQRGYEQLAQDPVLAQLPPEMQIAYRAQALGLQPVMPPSSYLRPQRTNEGYGIDLAREMPDLRVWGTGLPPEPGGYYRVEFYRGKEWAFPQTVPTVTVETPTGMVQVPRQQGPIPNALGPLARSWAQPRPFLNQYNEPVFMSAGQLTKEQLEGRAPIGLKTLGMGLAGIPTVTTTIKPGEPTTTVVRERPGLGGGAKGAIQGVGVGAGGAAAPVSDDPLGEAMYKGWMNGTRVLNEREQIYATQWAIRHGQPTEPAITLTPAGQRALADLDPIITEVQRTKNMLEQRMAPGGWTDKWGNHQPPLTKFDLIRDYTAYSKGHFDTPNSDLISSLSFSGLRSGAQAMKSIGSRAYPVLEKALEHTPIVSENFDSPEKSQTLLGEMLKRLGEGRTAILRDERKSGVIPGGGGGGDGENRMIRVEITVGPKKGKRGNIPERDFDSRVMKAVQ